MTRRFALEDIAISPEEIQLLDLNQTEIESLELIEEHSINKQLVYANVYSLWDWILQNSPFRENNAIIDLNAATGICSHIKSQSRIFVRGSALIAADIRAISMMRKNPELKYAEKVKDFAPLTYHFYEKKDKKFCLLAKICYTRYVDHPRITCHLEDAYQIPVIEQIMARKPPKSVYIFNLDPYGFVSGEIVKKILSYPHTDLLMNFMTHGVCRQAGLARKILFGEDSPVGRTDEYSVKIIDTLNDTVGGIEWVNRLAPGQFAKVTLDFFTQKIRDKGLFPVDIAIEKKGQRWYDLIYITQNRKAYEAFKDLPRLWKGEGQRTLNKYLLPKKQQNSVQKQQQFVSEKYISSFTTPHHEGGRSRVGLDLFPRG